MQGIILAAGMGKRLKELTNENTKCMVKVNGITMIERALRILDRKSLSRIVIVVGYQGQKLIDFIDTLNIRTPIIFIDNPVYDKTNNIYSLALAKEYLCDEDTLLLESDLVYEESVLDALLEDDRKNLALVDKFESWMDGTCMELDDEDCIVNFIPGKYLQFSEKENYYKTVNIYKFSADFSRNIYVPFLTAYEKAMGDNEYYESVIKLIAMLETREIRAKRLEGQVWYEIDNIQDLNIAESLFTESESEHYEKIARRYGGFWRYPKLLDYCYLVNPYYPPEKLKEEMKSNFETLLTEYPSGMEVNALLAAGAFGIKPEHIVVGNGAAELIKGLLEYLCRNADRKVGCIYPTFEEYPNRLKKEMLVPFVPSGNDMHYTVEDLMQFYTVNRVDTLVLINPDNPSGNYISYNDCIRFISWCKQQDIAVIIDESFVDFVDIGPGEDIADVSLIRDSILNEYPKLYIIKSISKSYGIPGARLGVLACGDEQLIQYLKKDVSIWNINSFGEFFLQIKEKYDRDYIEALGRLRECRKKFVQQLQDISFLEVYPSQANFVMCRLKGISSADLCTLMLKENIFVKDLTKKIKNGHQYIRLSVRGEEDNDRLIAVLRMMKKG